MYRTVILFLISLVFQLASTADPCTDHLYVVDNGHLIISNDGGLSWKYASGLSVTYVVASDSNFVFAGTSEGLYVSVDQGITWQWKNLIPHRVDYEIVAISVGTKFTLVAVVTHPPELHPFLFQSYDKGQTWSRISLPSANSVIIKSIEVDGDRIYLGCGLTGNGKDDLFYVSRDAGSTWSSVNSSTFGVVYSSIDTIAFEGSKIYLSGYPGGRFISVSNDSGVSWKSQDLTSLFGPNLYCIVDIVASNGLVYVSANLQCKSATATRLAISRDAGSTWSVAHDFTTDPPGILHNMRLAVSGKNIYYATSGGLYYSPDNGQTWATGSILSCRNGQKVIPCQIFGINAQCF